MVTTRADNARGRAIPEPLRELLRTEAQARRSCSQRRPRARVGEQRADEVPRARSRGAARAWPRRSNLALNLGSSAAEGWGIAMSTDTAFALGLFTLFGRGAPDRLRDSCSRS